MKRAGWVKIGRDELGRLGEKKTGIKWAGRVKIDRYNIGSLGEN